MDGWWFDTTYLTVNSRQTLPLVSNLLQGIGLAQVAEVAGSVPGTEEEDPGAPGRLGLTVVLDLARAIDLREIVLSLEEVSCVLGLGNNFGLVALYPRLVACRVLELVLIGGALQFLKKIGVLASAARDTHVCFVYYLFLCMGQ